MGQMDNENKAASEDVQLRRRLQGRKSQKTFRERQKRHHERLKSTVQNLQNDIARLEEKVSTLTRQVPLDLVRDVFSTFNGGLATKTARQYIGYNSSKIKLSARQESFLRTIASSDVRYNGGVGVKNILANWQRYTSAFSSICVEVPDWILIKTDDGAVVKGMVRSHLKISQSSLTTFFPNCPQHLKPVLVGQTFTIVSTMHWCFDENDRLVQLTGSPNFTTGLFNILQDIEAVAQVLKGSVLLLEETIQPNEKMKLSFIA